MPDAEPITHHFHGTLLPSDTATYITYPFDVPESCACLRFRLAYTPFRVGAYRNLVTLGLFDPKGFRGHAHRGHRTPRSSSPRTWRRGGFVAGPLPAGRWPAQLYVHAILTTPEPRLHVRH